jgi:hypothetical protein
VQVDIFFKLYEIFTDVALYTEKNIIEDKIGLREWGDFREQTNFMVN